MGTIILIAMFTIVIENFREVFLPLVSYVIGGGQTGP